MKKAYLFVSDGFEEIEGLMAVDLLRRAGIDMKMVSIQEKRQIVGSHNIRLEADCLFDEVDLSGADALILPGGMPGTRHLDAHEGLKAALKAHGEAGGLVAAICAAPIVLAHIGLLEGRQATCFPDFREEIARYGADALEDKAVWDGNVITARGVGASTEFALLLIEALEGKEKADIIAVTTQWSIK